MGARCFMVMEASGISKEKSNDESNDWFWVKVTMFVIVVGVAVWVFGAYFFMKAVESMWASS